MKLNELFGSADHGAEVENSEHHFNVKKMIGDRLISFSADRSDRDDWEVSFAEWRGDKVSVDMTGSGNEIQVMSFVVACMRDFIKRRNPERIVFGSEFSDKSRSTVYHHLVKRFGGDYELSPDDGEHGLDLFALTRKDK
jgi:hypothetical protein